MWCKNCRKETDLKKCDVCGKTTIADVPYEAYWCDDCNIPLIIKATEGERTVCPLCGKKVRYLTTDLRPVFPEERLLLELLFDIPLKYINSSVWASDNRYYIDGKSKAVSNTVFANADIQKLIKGLEEYKDQNSYAVFDFYVEKFVEANMNYNKLKEILRTKFSKKEIENLLGDKIYSAIVEWTDSEEAYIQTSLVELLVSITSYGIFQNKMFRKRFFRCIPFETLKELLNNNTSTYEELASKAAKIEFSNNEFYQKLFVEYFECPEYDFIDYVPEAMLETFSGTQEKFYELFDYQYLIKQQAVYELDKKTPLGRKVLIHMPTGTGKTKTTMHILAHYLNFINKNGLVLWVAHTKELLGQALETFSNVWNHLGLGEICVEKSWGNGEYTITRGMVFITIQALQSMRSSSSDEYLSLCNRTTLMVYDECHKIGAEETNKVVTEFTTSTEGNRKFFIGLTATPGRTTVASLENRIFNEFFDRKIEIDIMLVCSISVTYIDKKLIFLNYETVLYFHSDCLNKVVIVLLCSGFSFISVCPSNRFSILEESQRTAGGERNDVNYHNQKL